MRIQESKRGKGCEGLVMIRFLECLMREAGG